MALSSVIVFAVTGRRPPPQQPAQLSTQQGHQRKPTLLAPGRLHGWAVSAALAWYGCCLSGKQRGYVQADRPVRHAHYVSSVPLCSSQSVSRT